MLCVYGNAQRSVNTQYGGPQASGQLSYLMYAPWGMTSQGGLYAMSFRRHQLLYGTTEEQLGVVAVAFRKHASMNPNAVMYGKPITIDDYLESRYVAAPLHLLDYCLVNDGGVAFIIERADRAKDRKQPPVLVSGFGWAEADAENAQLRPRLTDFYHNAHHARLLPQPPQQLLQTVRLQRHPPPPRAVPSPLNATNSGPGAPPRTSR